MTITQQKTLIRALLAQQLSVRETDATIGLMHGLSNAQIGQRINSTEKVVKAMFLNVYSKLYLKSRAQLIVHCHNLLITEPESESLYE